MKELTKIWTLLTFTILVTWCSWPLSDVRTPFDELTQTPEYQQAKQQISSWAEFLWEKANEFIESNTWAQLIRDAANEKINIVTQEARKQYEQAKETAKDVWVKAQEEAKRQYENLKNEAKESIKDTLNKKVDEAFDKI